jgi:hypothetical protein
LTSSYGAGWAHIGRVLFLGRGVVPPGRTTPRGRVGGRGRQRLDRGRVEWSHGDGFPGCRSCLVWSGWDSARWGGCGCGAPPRNCCCSNGNVSRYHTAAIPSLNHRPGTLTRPRHSIFVAGCQTSADSREPSTHQTVCAHESDSAAAVSAMETCLGTTRWIYRP